MNGHVGHLGMGGFFLHPVEADTFRAAAYKAFDLRPEDSFNRSSTRLRVLYLPRAKDKDQRLLLNVEEMESMIQEDSRFLYKSIPIHLLPMRDQVKETMEADIVISVHGAAVATILFLLPHSAYVELRPPNFRDNWYDLQTNQAGLIYRVMNNFSYPLPRSCPSIDSTLNPPAFQKCWRTVHFANFNICVECLRDVMDQLFYSVNLLKYECYCVSLQTVHLQCKSQTECFRTCSLSRSSVIYLWQTSQTYTSSA